VLMDDVVVPMATIALASSDDISNCQLICSVDVVRRVRHCCDSGLYCFLLTVPLYCLFVIVVKGQFTHLSVVCC